MQWLLLLNYPLTVFVAVNDSLHRNGSVLNFTVKNTCIEIDEKSQSCAEMCIFLRRQTAFIYFVFVCDWLGLGFRLRGLVVRNWGQRYIIKVSVVGLGLVGGADVREGAVIFLFLEVVAWSLAQQLPVARIIKVEPGRCDCSPSGRVRLWARCAGWVVPACQGIDCLVVKATAGIVQPPHRMHALTRPR